MYDLGEAKRQRGSLVPPGIYRLRSKVLPHGHGPERLLKLSKSGFILMLAFRHTVVDGEFVGARVNDWVSLEYDPTQALGPLDPEQQYKFELATIMGRAKLCDMLESAHAIDPADTSEQAEAIRHPTSLWALDGLIFVASVKIKPAMNGFNEANTIDRIVTLDMPGWIDPKPGKENVKPEPRPLRDDLSDDIPF